MPDPRPHQYMDHDQFLAYLREDGTDTPQFPLQPGGPAIGLSPEEISDLYDNTDPKVTAWTAEAASIQGSEAAKKLHEKKDTDGKSLHNKKLHAKKDPVDGKSLQAKKMNRGLHKEKDSKDGKSLHAKKAGKKGGRGNCDGTETYHWCRSCQKVFTLQQQAGSTGTNTRCNGVNEAPHPARVVQVRGGRRRVQGGGRRGGGLIWRK